MTGCVDDNTNAPSTTDAPSTDVPEDAASTNVPDAPSTDVVPEDAPSTDVPDAASTDVPEDAPSTDVPDAASTNVPDAPSTDVPEDAASTDVPDAPSTDTAPGSPAPVLPSPAPAPVPVSLDNWGSKWETGVPPSWQCEDVNGVLTKVIPHDQLKGRVFVPLCGASVDLLWLAQLDAVTEVIGIEFYKSAVVQLAEETLKPAFGRETKKRKKTEQVEEVRFVWEKLPPREAWKQDETGADGVAAAEFSESVEVLRCGKISVYVADMFHPGLTPLFRGKFDVVYDRASLVAINLEDQEKYVDRMWEWTAAAARYFLVGVEYERGIRTGPPRIIADEEVGVLFGGHAGSSGSSGPKKWDIEPLEKDSVDHEFADMGREMGLVIRQHVYGMRKRVMRGSSANTCMGCG